MFGVEFGLSYVRSGVKFGLSCDRWSGIASMNEEGDYACKPETNESFVAALHCKAYPGGHLFKRNVLHRKTIHLAPARKSCAFVRGKEANANLNTTHACDEMLLAVCVWWTSAAGDVGRHRFGDHKGSPPLPVKRTQSAERLNGRHTYREQRINRFFFELIIP
jgi:hypothetical protein